MTPRSLLFVLLLGLAIGCGSPSEPTESSKGEPSKPDPAKPNDSGTDGTVDRDNPKPDTDPSKPEPADDVGSKPPAKSGELAKQLEALEVPPPWLAEVTTSYDTSKPWKDARLEIRRLLGKNEEAARKEAIKLTWIYLQKDDIGNGHEYPMYLHLGGEDVWAVYAHEWFLDQPLENEPIGADISLSGLYAKFGEFEKAKAALDRAMANLPNPPWRIMRKADVHNAYGDLYVAWGRPDDARDEFEEAAQLYPTAKPPYGGNLLKRRADKLQGKIALLAAKALETASLRDGTYKHRALGYSGDVNVTVTVSGGRIAKVDVQHQEKIEQGATKIVPARIVDEQSLQVDGVSGATVTVDAIVTGVYEALRKAGL